MGGHPKDGGPGVVFHVEAVRAPGDAHGGATDRWGLLLGAGCVSEVDDVAVAGYGWAGNCCGVIDVDGVSLGSSGVDLRGLQYRRHIDAYPLGNDGLGSWGEAEDASVWAPLGDIRVHQVEEVSRIGVELLARDGLSAFLVVFVVAEGGAFVL